jgi:hypothetical protein
MDKSARSPDDTAQSRLERRQQADSGFLAFVTTLDAMEGSHLLRACRKHLRLEFSGQQTNPGLEDVLGTKFVAPGLRRAWSQAIGRR